VNFKEILHFTETVIYVLPGVICRLISEFNSLGRQRAGMRREIVGKQVSENMHFLACQLILEPPVPLSPNEKKCTMCI